MSLEQAQAFAQGLQDLVTQFKADEKALADAYGQYVSDAGAEFQEKSHTYAKESVEKVDQLATDIQTLYQNTYGEPLPPPTGGEGGGETPPPDGLQDPDWAGGPNDPHVSTGPVGPQPKSKK